MFQAMYAVRERMDRAFSAPVRWTSFLCVMVCFGLSNFVSLQFTTAPYGRYSRADWGITVPARLAWFLQELPSFVVSLLISLGRYNDFQNLQAHNNWLFALADSWCIIRSLNTCFTLESTFNFYMIIRGVVADEKVKKREGERICS